MKIADIIIREAIDNSFGIARDDMTVIVVRIKQKKKMGKYKYNIFPSFYILKNLKKSICYDI